MTSHANAVVDLQQRVIVVRKRKTDANETALIAPISEPLFEILRDARARQGKRATRVVTYRKEPVKQIAESVRAAAISAGITYGWDMKHGVTFHSIRHSLSTLLAQKAVHPLLHQEFMGHEDAETTRGYTHLEPDDQRPVAERMAKTLRLTAMVTTGPIRARRQESLLRQESLQESKDPRIRDHKGRNRHTSGLRTGPSPKGRKRPVS